MYAGDVSKRLVAMGWQGIYGRAGKINLLRWDYDGERLSTSSKASSTSGHHNLLSLPSHASPEPHQRRSSRKEALLQDPSVRVNRVCSGDAYHDWVPAGQRGAAACRSNTPGCDMPWTRPERGLMGQGMGGIRESFVVLCCAVVCRRRRFDEAGCRTTYGEFETELVIGRVLERSQA